MNALDKKSTTPLLYKPDPAQIHGSVGWCSIDGKGRGVIALKPIAKDTVFERCPMLVMPYGDAFTEKGVRLDLNNYMFRWGDEDEHKVSPTMALGIGGHIGLYNHKPDCNADIKQDHANNLMEVFALRDIEPGEEITIDYDCDLWFDYTP